MENYEYFHHDGFKLAFRQAGKGLGNPVLLIHGFSGSTELNWVKPYWFDELLKRGYHVIGFDHRGHGLSDKSYDPADYAPELMASDGIALLDHLGLKKAHIVGYSMGGTLAVYTAMQAPERVQSAVFGGVGLPLLTERFPCEQVCEALLAPSLNDVPPDTLAYQFRWFAETNPNDLRALAACAANMGKTVTEQQLRQIFVPALVACGDADQLIPEPEKLTELLPRGETLLVPGCDHLATVGSIAYRKGVLSFFAKYPL